MQLDDKRRRRRGRDRLPALRWQTLEEGRFPTPAGEAVADVNAAKSAGVAVGDRLRVGSGSRAVDVRSSAWSTAPATLVYASLYLTWADLARASTTACTSTAWPGPAPGSTDALADRSGDRAGRDGADRATPSSSRPAGRGSTSGVDVLAIMLLLFAAIALFVSVLVIANTFSILFAQRQRDFALLRCVGATRRQLLRSVRLEALVLGVGRLGRRRSLVGTAARPRPGRPGRGRWPERPAGRRRRPRRSGTPAALAVGVLVTARRRLAADPARRSAVSPLAALRPDHGRDPHARPDGCGSPLGARRARRRGRPARRWRSRSRRRLGVVLGGAAVVRRACCCSDRSWCPALIRVGGRLRPVAGPARRLAADNAVRNPRRTAATTASLLVGVTLTTAVLTGLASSRSGRRRGDGRVAPAGRRP